MQKNLIITVCFCFFSVIAFGQSSKSTKDTISVVLENEKIKVTGYVSSPGKDACGAGLHSHPAHLTIFLTDATVKMTTPDGKSQNVSIKSGASIWFEAETHMVVNNGNKTAQVYLVEVKPAR